MTTKEGVKCWVNEFKKRKKKRNLKMYGMNAKEFERELKRKFQWGERTDHSSKSRYSLSNLQ